MEINWKVVSTIICIVLLLSIIGYLGYELKNYECEECEECYQCTIDSAKNEAHRQIKRIITDIDTINDAKIILNKNAVYTSALNERINNFSMTTFKETFNEHKHEFIKDNLIIVPADMMSFKIIKQKEGYSDTSFIDFQTIDTVHHKERIKALNSFFTNNEFFGTNVDSRPIYFGKYKGNNRGLIFGYFEKLNKWKWLTIDLLLAMQLIDIDIQI